VKINKAMGALGVAAMATAMLTACGSSDEAGTGTTGAAGASAASNCPLVGAPDPGNSKPPTDVTFAEKAPKVAEKDTYNVAFSQNASNNPWRLAETASFKSEAEKRGWKLTVTDANNDQAKQIQDIKGLIAQKPDALFIAPITEQLGNVVVDAAKAGVPVFLVDRNVDNKVAVPGEHFVSVMTSDFVQEGKRAAWAMANATGGKAQIIELEGTTGSSPAIDRKKGFTEAIAACPDMKVVVSQDADFARATGQSVTETLLQSNPTATAIYAHNDEMALGAIAALKAAGRTPGQDVKLVSIDGSKDALTAIKNGELFASVECSPHFGPKAFETMQAYAKGEQTPTQLRNEDRFFDASNAAQLIETAF
jgi:ribose transport system substrate-binding protein